MLFFFCANEKAVTLVFTFDISIFRSDISNEIDLKSQEILIKQADSDEATGQLFRK